jgi:hypothetical protein
MASVWIRERQTKSGTTSYRSSTGPGGRDASTRFAGSFRTKRLARLRAALVESELATGRIPDLTLAQAEPVRLPTLAEALRAWRSSRVDVDEQTRNMHRSSAGRILRSIPQLRGRRVDELTVDNVAALVAALAAAGYKRETIRKTLTALAQRLDFYKVEPNVARDERVKLPKERRQHIPPPLAEHVERVAERLPPTTSCRS